MTLRDLQQRFAAAMIHGDDAQALVRVDHMDVYRHAYVARLVEVLREVYPRTAEAHEAWDELAVTYLQRHPSRAPSLRAFGSELHTLLDGERAALARLEWALYDLFDAPDEDLLTRDDLAANIDHPLRRIAASRILEPATLVWRDGTTMFHRVLSADEAAFLSAPTSVAEIAEQLGDATKTFELVGRWIADHLLARETR